LGIFSKIACLDETDKHLKETFPFLCGILRIPLFSCQPCKDPVCKESVHADAYVWRGGPKETAISRVKRQKQAPAGGWPAEVRNIQGFFAAGSGPRGRTPDSHS
jgi:hypothetical protein